MIKKFTGKGILPYALSDVNLVERPVKGFDG